MKVQACGTKFSRGNIAPFTSVLTTVGMPPTLLVTTGSPTELASAMTTGTQSALVGSTKKCASASRLSRRACPFLVFLGMKPFTTTKSGVFLGGWHPTIVSSVLRPWLFKA
jgi:hypothetical protein